jgi:hypothetical protein
MIIKYRDLHGKWNWLSNVGEATALGYMDEPPEGAVPLGVASGKPYVMSLCVKNESRTVAIYAQEAYLTDDQTGNTIEILIPRNGNGKTKAHTTSASKS